MLLVTTAAAQPATPTPNSSFATNTPIAPFATNTPISPAITNTPNPTRSIDDTMESVIEVGLPDEWYILDAMPMDTTDLLMIFSSPTAFENFTADLNTPAAGLELGDVVMLLSTSSARSLSLKTFAESITIENEMLEGEIVDIDYLEAGRYPVALIRAEADGYENAMLILQKAGFFVEMLVYVTEGGIDPVLPTLIDIAASVEWTPR